LTVFAFRAQERPIRVIREALLGASRGSEIERLYRDHGGRLWHALVGFSGDPEIASDALAEAFAQALRRGEAIRDPLRWVWRAAFRIARGELKERGRHGAIEREGSYELEEPAVELMGALRRLSSRQRAAVVLFHLADYPVKEVAAMLGTSSSAVRVHLTRGRRRLRRLLEGSDD
jgi:RNA polymerase sigma-70 factor, ECF subfamily